MAHYVIPENEAITLPLNRLLDDYTPSERLQDKDVEYAKTGLQDVEFAKRLLALHDAAIRKNPVKPDGIDMKAFVDEAVRNLKKDPEILKYFKSNGINETKQELELFTREWMLNAPKIFGHQCKGEAYPDIGKAGEQGTGPIIQEGLTDKTQMEKTGAITSMVDVEDENGNDLKVKNKKGEELQVRIPRAALSRWPKIPLSLVAKVRVDKHGHIIGYTNEKNPIDTWGGRVIEPQGIQPGAVESPMIDVEDESGQFVTQILRSELYRWPEVPKDLNGCLRMDKEGHVIAYVFEKDRKKNRGEKHGAVTPGERHDVEIPSEEHSAQIPPEKHETETLPEKQRKVTLPLKPASNSIGPLSGSSRTPPALKYGTETWSEKHSAQIPPVNHYAETLPEKQRKVTLPPKPVSKYTAQTFGVSRTPSVHDSKRGQGRWDDPPDVGPPAYGSPENYTPVLNPPEYVSRSSSRSGVRNPSGNSAMGQRSKSRGPLSPQRRRRTGQSPARRGRQVPGDHGRTSVNDDSGNDAIEGLSSQGYDEVMNDDENLIAASNDGGSPASGSDQESTRRSRQIPLQPRSRPGYALNRPTATPASDSNVFDPTTGGSTLPPGDTIHGQAGRSAQPAFQPRTPPMPFVAGGSTPMDPPWDRDVEGQGQTRSRSGGLSFLRGLKPW